MTVVNLHLGCKYVKAAQHGGKRRESIKYIVIHSTETGNYRGSAAAVAKMFAETKSAKSTTITIDDYDCYRSLTDEFIPWAAPPFNSRGLHIELCGKAKWTRAEWMQHKETIRKGAQAAAYWALAYRIPIRWLQPAACKQYEKGITSHRNVSEAFGLSDHTDPGPPGNKNFPYDYFMERCRMVAAPL